MRSPAPHVRRALRGPADPVPGHSDPADGARRVFYQRLARVTVRHGYYRATGGACPDFTVQPTGATALLMRSLGLLFRQEADGFSVMYNELRKQQLLDFLDRDRQPVTRQPWTRLCFVLSVRNPWFVNFTAVPIDTNPARHNFYLTNRQAHVNVRGAVLLPPGARVTGEESVPVTGGQFVEVVDDRVDSVRVLDVSGEVVVCKARCVARVASPPEPADPLDCHGEEPGPGVVCSDRLYFDLTGLPEEKYYLQTVWRNGDPPRTCEYLYTAPHPIPLCFVELLFSDPCGASAPAAATGVYPVHGLGTPRAAIEGVSYLLPFAARRTWWSYYVVAEPPAGERGDLRIRQVRGPGERRVAFRGPCLVRLADGRTASRFVSTRPLALRQRSRLHLQLVRVREARVDVLMDALPLAQGRQVLPLTPRQACDQARESLCPGRRGRGCQELMDWLCPGGSPPEGPRRNFSDIYVHV